MIKNARFQFESNIVATFFLIRAQTFNKIRIVVRWMKLNELKLLAADELVFVTTDNASCY